MGKWQKPEGHKMSVVSRRRNRDTPIKMMIIMIGKMMMRMRGMVMRMKMLVMVMVVIVMVMIIIKRTVM